MEFNLFSWESYTIYEHLRIVFLGCTLKKSIFDWKMGDMIQEIELDYLQGSIKFFEYRDLDKITLDEFVVDISILEKR